MADNESMSYAYKEYSKEKQKKEVENATKAFITKAIKDKGFKGMGKASIAAMILKAIDFGMKNSQGQHKTARDLFSGRYLAGGGADPFLDEEGARGYDKIVSNGWSDLFDKNMSDEEKFRSISTMGQYDYFKNFGKSTEDTWRAVTGGLVGGESDLKSVANKALKPWETFGGGSRREREEAQEVENTGTIKQAFNQAFGRDPSEAEDTLYRDAIRAGQLNSPQEVLDDLKSQPEYKQRHSEGGGEHVDYMQEFLRRINSIGEYDIIPEKEYGKIDQYRTGIENTISDIRSGKIAPEVATPEQRQRYIDRAKNTYQRELDASEVSHLTNLNKRGILPSVQTGVSGLAEDVLSNNRAKVYENPLTSFIRDYDISEEDWRRQRSAQLMDKTFPMQELLLNSADNMGKFIGTQRINSALGVGTTAFNYDNMYTNNAFNTSQLDWNKEKYRLEAEEKLRLAKEAQERGDGAMYYTYAKEAWDAYSKYKGSGSGSTGGGNIDFTSGYDTGTYSGGFSANDWDWESSSSMPSSDYSSTDDWTSGYDTGTWDSGYDADNWNWDAGASYIKNPSDYSFNANQIAQHGAPMASGDYIKQNPLTGYSTIGR